MALIKFQQQNHAVYRWAVGLVSMLACLLLTVSCQRTEERRVESLDRTELMLLPFPTWRADGPQSIQEVDLSEAVKRSPGTQSVASHAKVTPIYVVKLNPTHAVMLTDTRPYADDSKMPYDCHACSGIIGAYFFEHDEHGWRLTARQDGVTQSGVNGNIGVTSLVKLSEEHYALTADWGSCWQGYCGSWLVVVGLKPGKAALMTSGIPIEGDNAGAVGPCDQSNAELKDRGDELECFGIHGSWKFLDESLYVEFAGMRGKFHGSRRTFASEEIQQQAIYKVVDGTLKLIKGSNPVPSF